MSEGLSRLWNFVKLMIKSTFDLFHFLRWENWGYFGRKCQTSLPFTGSYFTQFHFPTKTALEDWIYSSDWHKLGCLFETRVKKFWVYFKEKMSNPVKNGLLNICNLRISKIWLLIQRWYSWFNRYCKKIWIIEMFNKMIPPLCAPNT